jgi:D-sedoheptulose 7-phosphate isomerase
MGGRTKKIQKGAQTTLFLTPGMNAAKRVAEPHLRASIAAKQEMLDSMLDEIARLAAALKEASEKGGTLLFCGNGGSAADAQHWATELVVRYKKERPAVPAIALTTDTSALTAAGNDLGFERIFARQVEALATPKDVLVCVSTSGRSKNVIAAATTARMMGVKTVGITGASGGPLADVVDLCFRAPSDDTAVVQECHEAIGHILCAVFDS